MYTVDYAHGQVALKGRLARPAGSPKGGVLIFPTILNGSPAVEARAEQLCRAGFVTFIADFYGEHPASFDEAARLAQDLRADIDHYRARLVSALSTFRDVPEVAGLPIAVIGYCMGGQAALEVARAGEDVALVASFHGLLETDRRADPSVPVIPRILVCHGDADPLAPRGRVTAFWEEMDAVNANWHFHSYSGVRHGFTDPGSDKSPMPALGYDASADRQSWRALMGLLDEMIDRNND